MKTEEIKNAKLSIDKAIGELKKLFNDRETSLREMDEIMQYARLLDSTDFVRTITD